MTTTTTTNASGNLDAGNLVPVLHSAALFPLALANDKQAQAGYRFARLIKKGTNSKLPESVAVEVPALVARQLPTLLGNATVAEYLVQSAQKLQDAAIKARIEAGDKVIQFSEISVEALAHYLVTNAANGGNGLGQLSADSIVAWFDGEARELYMVALADRLGISDTANEADVKRLEQIANQTRDNLKKLSSKKLVHFDPRVKAALNWALEVVSSDDDAMGARLYDKLNVAEVVDNMADALGF